MEKYYEKAADQHIRAAFIYLHSDDGVAYAEKGGHNPINKETLIDMFNLGIAVVVNTETGEYYRPTSIKVEASQASLTYLTTDSAVTAATVVSQEAE